MKVGSGMKVKLKNSDLLLVPVLHGGERGRGRLGQCRHIGQGSALQLRDVTRTSKRCNKLSGLPIFFYISLSQKEEKKKKKKMRELERVRKFGFYTSVRKSLLSKAI